VPFFLPLLHLSGSGCALSFRPYDAPRANRAPPPAGRLLITLYFNSVSSLCAFHRSRVPSSLISSRPIGFNFCPFFFSLYFFLSFPSSQLSAGRQRDPPLVHSCSSSRRRNEMDETRTAEIGIRVRTAIVRHSSRGRPQPPTTRRGKPASDYDTTVVRSWRNNRPRSATA